MFIHQIFINNEGGIPKELPPIYYRSSQKLQALYPEANYRFYSRDKLEQIISNKFDKEVLTAFNTLQPYACKADLARYCLLYLYGGLYCDITIEFLHKIPMLDKLHFFAFRDFQRASRRSWSVYNGIIFARKKSPIMQKAIQLVVENCKNKYYGYDAIDVSACTVLGKAVMSSSEDPAMIATCGQFDEVPHPDPSVKETRAGFVWDDTGTVLALYKFLEQKSDVQGDLTKFGFKGTNNYRQMWRDKKVYGEYNEC